MKKEITVISFLLMILFTVSIASAYTTQIKINTLPKHYVAINTLSPTTLDVKDTFSGNASGDGTFTLDYATNSNQKFALNIMISKDKKFVVTPTHFGNFSVGEPLEFNMKPGLIGQVILEPEEPECVESWTCTEYTDCSKEGTQTRVCTDDNVCGTEESKPSESQECEYKSGLTGFVVDVKDKAIELNDKVNWAYVLYGVLGLLALGGITMFIIKGRHKFKPKKLLVLSKKDNVLTEHLPDMHFLGGGGDKKPEAKPEVDEKKLEVAEEKLEEAQKEIQAIKEAREKNDSVSKAQREFEEAKKKLEEAKEAEKD